MRQKGPFAAAGFDSSIGNVCKRKGTEWGERREEIIAAKRNKIHNAQCKCWWISAQQGTEITELFDCSHTVFYSSTVTLKCPSPVFTYYTRTQICWTGNIRLRTTGWGRVYVLLYVSEREHDSLKGRRPSLEHKGLCGIHFVWDQDGSIDHCSRTSQSDWRALARLRTLQVRHQWPWLGLNGKTQSSVYVLC